MTVNAIEGVSGYVSTDLSTVANQTQATDDKQLFLELLATQMKYQDPLNPMDNSQFLAQTAQFTALEKMQEVADATMQLLAAQQAFGASNLIGRSVSYVDATGASALGTVSSVTFGSAGPSLNVNGQQIALGDVVTVSDASSSTTSDPTTTSDSSTS